MLERTRENSESAASDLDFPWADIGIHINSKEIGAALAARFEAIFPELQNAGASSASMSSIPTEIRWRPGNILGRLGEESG